MHSRSYEAESGRTDASAPSRDFSGWFGVGAGAARGGAPFGLAVGSGLCERAANAFGIEVAGVHGRSGLLPPRFVEWARIDRVETQFIDQAHDFGLGGWIVARNRERNAIRISFGATQVHKMLRVDIVEGLDHRAFELLLDPAALGHPLFDGVDAAVPLLGIVVTRVDHHNAVEGARE